MRLLKKLFTSNKNSSIEKQLEEFLGFKPKNISVYRTALTHRSVKDQPEANNERLEYLGDAVLSLLVADYLVKRYPYKGEGFLTEMRSKMVNRQQLNDVATRMGLKKLVLFNRIDNALKSSQIFGNTLEAMVGAVYFDKGYKFTQNWVLRSIIIPHLFVDNLESVDINLKNKLIGWAGRNGKTLTFEVLEEKKERNRHVFTIGIVLDGEVLAKGTGFTKKDAGQAAALLAADKLQLGQDK